MKNLLIALAATLGLTALAEFADIPGAPAPFSGKPVALAVSSTTAAKTVTLKRIRHFETWTNGLKVTTNVSTNWIQTFNASNGTWSVTNRIDTTYTTNAVSLLEYSKWDTGTVATAVCSGGFALTNVTDGAWFVPGDLIFADGADAKTKATLVFEK